MRTTGRKCKLTPELMTQIEAALQGHSTVASTCDMLGISRETYYKWLREGETARSGIKADFLDTVKRAQGMSRIVLTNAIAKDPSWQAKAWLLERMYPKEYGRRQLIAHAGADGESDIPTATTAAPAVRLVVNLQQPDGTRTPWIYRDNPDQPEENGSDMWPSENQAWPDVEPGAAAPPTAHPPPPSRPDPVPDRGGTPIQTTNGKPRDPDDDGG